MIALALPMLLAAAPGPLVARDASVGGRTYPQWEVAFAQWRVALHRRAEHSDKRCAMRGQHGPVWFLHGNVLPSRPKITRACTVPAGRYLMLGLPSLECSTALRGRLHATTDAALRRCARREWKRNGARSEVVSLDGSTLDTPGFVLTTPAYPWTTPPKDNIYRRPGLTNGRSAISGYSTLLRPLSAGRHTLVQSFRYRDEFRRTVTYELTVRP